MSQYMGDLSLSLKSGGGLKSGDFT